MTNKAFLIRHESKKKYTLGVMCILIEGKLNSFVCHTLEPAWNDNKKNISCIPKGKYIVVPRHSKKFNNHFEVLGVKNRTSILIHSGNFPEDTSGCIIVGEVGNVSIGEKWYGVTNSLHTLKEMVKFAPNGFDLWIG